MFRIPIGPFFDDPNDNLPPTGGGAPTPEPPRNRRTVCEFCECQLTPNGEIVRMGEKAKKFRVHDETIEKHVKRIADLESELAEEKRKVAALTPSKRASLADAIGTY